MLAYLPSGAVTVSPSRHDPATPMYFFMHVGHPYFVYHKGVMPKYDRDGAGEKRITPRNRSPLASRQGDEKPPLQGGKTWPSH